MQFLKLYGSNVSIYSCIKWTYGTKSCNVIRANFLVQFCFQFLHVGKVFKRCVSKVCKSNLLPIQIIALGKLLQKRYIQNFLETIIPTNQHLNKLTVSYIFCTLLADVYRDPCAQIQIKTARINCSPTPKLNERIVYCTKHSLSRLYYHSMRNDLVLSPDSSFQYCTPQNPRTTRKNNIH